MLAHPFGRPQLIDRRQVASIHSEASAARWLRALQLAPADPAELRQLCHRLASGQQVLVLGDGALPLDPVDSIELTDLVAVR